MLIILIAAKINLEKLEFLSLIIRIQYIQAKYREYKKYLEN